MLKQLWVPSCFPASTAGKQLLHSKLSIMPITEQLFTFFPSRAVNVCDGGEVLN